MRPHKGSRQALPAEAILDFMIGEPVLILPVFDSWKRRGSNLAPAGDNYSCACIELGGVRWFSELLTGEAWESITGFSSLGSVESITGKVSFVSVWVRITHMPFLSRYGVRTPVCTQGGAQQYPENTDEQEPAL